MLEFRNCNPTQLSFVISTSLLTLAAWAYLIDPAGQGGPNHCSMSYMYPLYRETRIPTHAFFSYRLFQYSDGRVPSQASTKNTVPVVFVPGNAGDYKQLSALHSGLVQAQSAYLCEVLHHLKTLYDQPAIVVAHSMGGLVVQGCLDTDAVLTEWVALHVHLATPTFAPIIMGINTLTPYHTTRLPPDRVVAIAGGARDLLVRDTLFSNTTLSSGGIRGVAMANDHLSITWCRELMFAVADAITAARKERLSATSVRKALHEPWSADIAAAAKARTVGLFAKTLSTPAVVAVWPYTCYKLRKVQQDNCILRWQTGWMQGSIRTEQSIVCVSPMAAKLDSKMQQAGEQGDSLRIASNCTDGNVLAMLDMPATALWVLRHTCTYLWVAFMAIALHQAYGLLPAGMFGLLLATQVPGHLGAEIALVVVVAGGCLSLTIAWALVSLIMAVLELVPTVKHLGRTSPTVTLVYVCTAVVVDMTSAWQSTLVCLSMSVMVAFVALVLFLVMPSASERVVLLSLALSQVGMLHAWVYQLQSTI
eukprot:TRINITY_DN10481_c0_g1_i2.p1 TRINITY_DN10481_c0_g1~~TRINITY_DN10481_c0_g1_i2.p1  ORF type:complete len:534 (+),score=46.16 TRINITY_DN10481_c0_g1_i2:999-2600(+)